MSKQFKSQAVSVINHLKK